MTILDNWSTDRPRYSAPELGELCVVGDLRGEDKKIRTSPVKGCRGRVVTTQSGTEYRLGRIDPRFRGWLKKAGIVYAQSQPISIGKPCERAT